MLDVFNVNDNSANNQVFYTKGITDWQIWTKPQGIRFVSIFCLGSGGGGGAGQAGAGSTTRRGGGGGGFGKSCLHKAQISICLMHFLQ